MYNDNSSKTKGMIITTANLFFVIIIAIINAVTANKIACKTWNPTYTLASLAVKS